MIVYRARLLWILAILLLAGASAHAQGLKLEVKRDGPTPKAGDNTRKIHLRFDISNIGQERHKDLLVLWTLVIDESDKPGPHKYIDELKIVSLLPGDTTTFNSRAIDVSAKGKKPNLVGYAVKIQAGNKVLTSKIEPQGLAKEIEEYEKEKASVSRKK